jgi:hypothetical protein
MRAPIAHAANPLPTRTSMTAVFNDDRSAVVSASLREGWNRSEGSAESQRGEAYRDFEPHVLLFLVQSARRLSEGGIGEQRILFPSFQRNVLGAILIPRLPSEI